MMIKPVTLDDILKSRDDRAARQRQLLGDYAGYGDIALFSFTVNYPGDVKLNADTRRIHVAGAEALERLLQNAVIHSEKYELFTGPEGYWVAKMQPREAKARAVALEESHPLGRLFDIDVLSNGGLLLDRTALGLSPRSCLLCGDNPAICRREKRHTLDELKERIHEILTRLYEEDSNNRL